MRQPDFEWFPTERPGQQNEPHRPKNGDRKWRNDDVRERISWSERKKSLNDSNNWRRSSRRRESDRKNREGLCSETSYPIGYILIYKLFIPGIFQFSYCMCIVELFRIIRSNIWGDCLFFKDLWWCNFQDLFKCVLNKDCLMICWGCKLIDKVYPQNYRNIDIPRMLI